MNDKLIKSICNYANNGMTVIELQDFKAPKSSKWQLTQHRTCTELFTDYENGDPTDKMFNNGKSFDGFGVLCAGYLIVDVDDKDGKQGYNSYMKLVELIPELAMQCGYVVTSGSGGNSQHLYFKLPSDINKKLRTTHTDYPDIDFKSSGQVVGAGSLHESGNRYTVQRGTLADITEAPSELVELLTHKEVTINPSSELHFGMPIETLKDMLAFIDPDCNRDIWVSVGMGISYETQGSDYGFLIWDEWSAKGSKYNHSEMGRIWQSFTNKLDTPLTGSFVHDLASKNGYRVIAPWENAKPTAPVEIAKIDNKPKPPLFELDLSHIDLDNPHGAVGEFNEEILLRQHKERKKLAVMASLSTFANIAGHKYITRDGFQPNLIWLGVAGSSTGKDLIVKTFSKICEKLDLNLPSNGIKSDKELFVSFYMKQRSIFNIDEMGGFLAKVNSGAHHHVATMTAIMSLITSNRDKVSYSSTFPEDMISRALDDIKHNKSKIKQLKKDIESGDSGEFKGRDEYIIKTLEAKNDLIYKNVIEQKGLIVNPYLSVMGVSTPVGFTEFFSNDDVEKGLLGRAMMFIETIEAPELKIYRDGKKPPPSEFPEHIINRFKSIECVGNSAYPPLDLSLQKTVLKPIVIKDDDGVEDLLNDVKEYFNDLSKFYARSNGHHGLPGRGYELVRKVSMIFAIADQRAISKQDVLYALKLVISNINTKSQFVVEAVSAKEAERDGTSEQLVERVIHVTKEEPVHRGRLLQNICKVNKFSKERAGKAINFAVKHGYIQTKEIESKKQKTKSTVYFKKPNSPTPDFGM